VDCTGGLHGWTARAAMEYTKSLRQAGQTYFLFPYRSCTHPRVHAPIHPHARTEPQPSPAQPSVRPSHARPPNPIRLRNVLRVGTREVRLLASNGPHPFRDGTVESPFRTTHVTGSECRGEGGARSIPLPSTLEVSIAAAAPRSRAISPALGKWLSIESHQTKAPITKRKRVAITASSENQ
jgi:hypothetical protein